MKVKKTVKEKQAYNGSKSLHNVHKLAVFSLTKPHGIYTRLFEMVDSSEVVD